MKFLIRNLGVSTLALFVCLALVAGCGETDEETNQNDVVNQTNGETPAAEFTIEIDAAASELTVTEGDPVVIAFIVENTGDEDGTATVSLSLNSHTDEMEIAVEAGASASGSFTWTTTEGDAGAYTAAVSVDDVTDSVSVTVTEEEEPAGEAFFEVTIDEENSTLEVDEGDPLIIIIIAANTGDAAAILELTAQLELEDGSLVGLGFEAEGDAANTPIEPGQGAQLEATLPTGPGEQELPAGTHTMTISSEHDSASVQLIVN